MGRMAVLSGRSQQRLPFWNNPMNLCQTLVKHKITLMWTSRGLWNKSTLVKDMVLKVEAATYWANFDGVVSRVVFVNERRCCPRLPLYDIDRIASTYPLSTFTWLSFGIEPTNFTGIISLILGQIRCQKGESPSNHFKLAIIKVLWNLKKYLEVQRIDC